MLSNFKEKLNAPTSNGKITPPSDLSFWARANLFGVIRSSDTCVSVAMQSTTPVGTPPQDFISLNPSQPAQAAPAPDTSAILANLQALANMAKQNPIGPTMPGNPAQGSASSVTFPQNAFSNMSTSVNPTPSVPSSAHVNVPGAQNINGVFSYPGMATAPQSFMPQPNGISNVQTAPANAVPQGNGGAGQDLLNQQLQLLQLLRAQNVPQEQWAPLLAVLTANSGAGNAAAAPAPTPAAYGTFNQAGGRDDPSRDRNGYDQHYRSPPRGYRKRSRSRSPSRWDRGRESPPARRRDSPVYGEYGNDRNGRGGDFGRRGGAARGRGNGFRQRSPDRFRRSPSPAARRGGAEQPLPAPGPKWIQYEPSIGEGNIKGKPRQNEDVCIMHLTDQSTVVSRTLFVGGVT